MRVVVPNAWSVSPVLQAFHQPFFGCQQTQMPAIFQVSDILHRLPEYRPSEQYSCTYGEESGSGVHYFCLRNTSLRTGLIIIIFLFSMPRHLGKASIDHYLK